MGWDGGGGRQFESGISAKFMSLAQCIILWSKKLGPPVKSSLDFIYPLYLSLGQVNSLML